VTHRAMCSWLIIVLCGLLIEITGDGRNCYHRDQPR
jgi:hypothetical protein